MRGRVRLLGILILLILGLLWVRAAQLQLVQGDEFLAASEQQRLRILSVAAPRGRIYSGDGEVLATNRPAFVVQYLPSSEPLGDDQLQLLSELVDTPKETILAAIDKQTADRPYAPVDLKIDLSAEEYTRVMENLYQLPGVRVEAQPVRHYPQGELASHVLGYVLQIDERELETFEEMSDRRYENRDLVGKAGIERTTEFNLQGWDGEVRAEVDAHMRLIDSVTGREPRAGDNVHLTLDSELQRTAEDALKTVTERLQEGHNPLPVDSQTGRYLGLWDEGELRPADTSDPRRKYEDATSGAAVVLDVNSGAVLAMASFPDYDPNDFAVAPLHLSGTEGAKKWEDTWGELTDPVAGQPLLNRCVAETSPPGSTFKMVTALAALEHAGMDPSESERCAGGLDIFGQEYRCWTSHGSVDLRRAIAESCNTFFYRAALSSGIDDLAQTAREFGFGEPTGVEGLPTESESAGVRPDSAWKREALGESWYPGETLMAGIGQGYHAYTPLQMAIYASTLASGGERMRPFLVERVVDSEGDVAWEAEPEVVHELSASAENIRHVQQGMEAAIESGGTGHTRFWEYPQVSPKTGEEVSIAGKTGTAEVGGVGSQLDNHGWFVAYAPAHDPEIAVASIIYHGGGGSMAAAPVVRAIMDGYFEIGQPAVPSTGDDIIEGE